MERMAGKEPDTGPTSSAVAANVAKFRGDLGMNYTELSEQLEKIAGWSINAVGIRRIEKGERRVTPDDLVALALAFRVSPISLLMPQLRTVQAEDEVTFTGMKAPMRADTAWAWLQARELPTPAGRPIADGNAFQHFVDRACPTWVREAIAEQYMEAAMKALDELDASRGSDRKGGPSGDD